MDAAINATHAFVLEGDHDHFKCVSIFNMNYDAVNVQNVSHIYGEIKYQSVYSSSRLTLIEAVILLPLKEMKPCLHF